MLMRAKARITAQPPALPGETRGRSMGGSEGGRYSQGTTCSDRLRGRRFPGATRFPGQSPGLDCLSRLRAPTIRPTNSRQVSRTLKFCHRASSRGLLGENSRRHSASRLPASRWRQSLHRALTYRDPGRARSQPPSSNWRIAFESEAMGIFNAMAAVSM